MSRSTNPVQELIEEVRSAFETETTIGRILGRTKECLERFLANPASLGQIKQSLERVLARKAIPYGQPVDQEGYGSWRLYTDPTHLFCIRPPTSALRPRGSRMIMASSDGQSTVSWRARQSSKSTSALMMAVNRGGPSCEPYRQSDNGPAR